MSEQPTQEFLSEAMDFLTPIIKQAGGMALESWDKIEISKQKDSRDIATKADVEIENFLKEKIIGKWPDHGFWGEEGERVNAKSPYQWLADPIDQTKLYAKQTPIFYVHIALRFEKKTVLGLIYNPVSKQLFSAFEGNGAFLNNKLILPKSPVSFDRAIIDVDFRSFRDKEQKEREWMLEKLNKIIEKSYRTRMSGGALNIYLVTGAFDAYVRIEDETKLQDVAPRIIIMREAGYKTEWIKNNFDKKILIVAQEPLLSEIKKIIND
ncbi:MAG: inositol monophosphatase family protein [bacterium]|nr:inositol monophosphatase family protein [bacterium]